MLLHLLTPAEWRTAQATGLRIAPSLETAGFVHCSAPSQVQATANRIFRGSGELVLLVIDPARLAHEVRWEHAADAGEPFPHVYGPINVDAVLEALPYPEGPDGYGLPPRGAVREG